MFPHPSLADDAGLLAVGGDLSPQRLLLAYRYGIFPWYNEEPILWWSPNPRCILWPHDLKVSKSMRHFIRKSELVITVNQDFETTIENCKNAARRGQDGTWITEEMKEAYLRLHTLGYAHSVEAWQGNVMVAGLYGIALGKVFFGESMFTTVPNGSKLAFIQLVRFLQLHEFKLIDCQQDTAHLRSLGATTIASEHFLRLLRENNRIPEDYRNWHGRLWSND